MVFFRLNYDPFDKRLEPSNLRGAQGGRFLRVRPFARVDTVTWGAWPFGLKGKEADPLFGSSLAETVAENRIRTDTEPLQGVRFYR